MRPRPTALLALAAATVILLATAPSASACPPSPIGLEGLIEAAEQAVYVEVIGIEPSVLGILLEMADRVRETTVGASGLLSDDLSILVEEYFPDLGDGSDFPLTVTARVLATLDPDGPSVGRVIRWPHDSWFHWGLVPGQRAVVFVARRPWPIPTLTLLDAPDSVLTIADHRPADELIATVEAGFANKREGKIATRAWLRDAVRAPAARVHLSLPAEWHPLSLDFVADALITSPTGTGADIALLHSLRDLPRDDLDLLALELAESWLERSIGYYAKNAIELALERWQIPAPESISSPLGTVDVDLLRAYWRDIVEEKALPRVENPRLRAEAAAWQRMREEITAFNEQLGRGGDW